MPDVVKIGFTSRSPEERAREAYNTSVPTRFNLTFAIKSDYAEELEDKIHLALDHYRTDTNREFFSLSPMEARDRVLQLAEKSGRPFSIYLDTLQPDNATDNHPIEFKQLEQDLLVHAVRFGLLRFDIKTIPKEKGVYIFFLDKTVAYIGSSTGKVAGLFRRIGKEHLRPEYLEYRSEIWRKTESYQIENAMPDSKGRPGIDKSVFRRAVAIKHRLTPGIACVNYIRNNFTLSYFVLPESNNVLIRKLEGQLIEKYQPPYNTSHKRPRLLKQTP